MMQKRSFSCLRRISAAFVCAAMLSTAALAQQLPSVADVVEATMNTVVHIKMIQAKKAEKVEKAEQLSPEMQEFQRRFGVPKPDDAPAPGPKSTDPEKRPLPEKPKSGTGSGFIISADGYLITNAHVVQDTESLTIRLFDKREFKAKIIGADAKSDIALLKIEAAGLPFVKIADLTKLRVGDWVIAIGSPFGFNHTVSAGVVSMKARDTGDLNPAIQSDVAINPGNSGGPLFNLKGEVVGVNSQIFSPTGGSHGISFSIPIDEAIRVANILRTDGFVRRGKIGVTIANSPDDEGKGAKVMDVEAGGAADRARIKEGDVIVSFDGKPILESIDVSRAVAAKAGATVKVEIIRSGKRISLTVVVEATKKE